MKFNSADTTYILQLLEAWELTHKKGQLTFWVLLSLKEGRKSLEDIMQFIANTNHHNLAFDEQSLYRALRKFHETEIVDFEMAEGNRGPMKKIFTLTTIGSKLLSLFIERNIIVYQQKKIIDLLNL